MTVVFFASVLAIVAEGRYIYSICKGKSRPNFSGWFIFVISMSLVLVSSYALGARESLIVIGIFTLLHATVAVLALMYGYTSFSKVDILALCMVGLGLILWLTTSNPWYTLLINVGIDACGYVTIISKTYQNPGSEDYKAWGMSFGAYLLSLIAITTWIPQEYLFSVSNVLFCGMMSILSLRK